MFRSGSLTMKQVAANVAAVAVIAITMANTAYADEAVFLKTLAGSWSGEGMVKVRANAPSINVTCDFESNATGSSLALDGRCTSLAVFSRAISADLESEGATYTGSYVGAGTGTAGLGGQRAGDAIDLNILWAKNVNGDRKAKLTIQKRGKSGMSLITSDTDPTTGETIVTSSIELRRS
jgi:hypothetical protein